MGAKENHIWQKSPLIFSHPNIYKKRHPVSNGMPFIFKTVALVIQLLFLQ
jgi:hypothetical protein